ncbi:MAG: hypothetical protein Q8L92_05885, partial [Rubrivivax sp.]|nr:hypothetical protein [Rubrivivax sp.]
MTSRIPKIFGSAVLALGVTLGSVAPSQAAVMVLSYDPVYGSPFSNLAWRVTSRLHVNDGCTLASNQPIYAKPAECGHAQIRDTRLYFYDKNDLLQTAVETFFIGTYVADEPPPVETIIEETQQLFELAVSPAGVTGFQTTFSIRRQSTSPLGKFDVGGQQAWFSLSLSFGGAELVHFNTEGQSLSSAWAAGQRSDPQSPMLIERTWFETDALYAASLLPPQRVPEPGSAALVLAA